MPPLTLQARRIYILPTAPGVAAAALLFVMLLAGMNYNNSLALLLCFMLCGVALVSMHECHRMLSGLTAAARRSREHLRRATGRSCSSYFENGRRARAPALTLRCRRLRRRAAFDLPAGGTQLVRLALSGRRARAPAHRAARTVEQTRRWGCFAPGPGCTCRSRRIVYPAPARRAAAAAARRRAALRGARPARVSGEEEWAWLRPFAGERSAAQRRLESLRARRTAAGGALRCTGGRAAACWISRGCTACRWSSACRS